MTDNILDSCGVVLHGPAVSKDQMKELYDYYKSLGIDNIVISSYSDSIPDDMADEDFVINNDDILGKYRVVGGPSSLNYHILSTRNGISYFKNNEDIKYILKCRADMKVNLLDSYLKKWVDILSQLPLATVTTGEDLVVSSPLEKKILALGRCSSRERNPWYIADYFYFGTKLDQITFWDIPLAPLKTSLSKIPRAEEYLSSAFLGGMNKARQLKLNHADYFVFVPHMATDLYSYKWKRDMTHSLAMESKKEIKIG